MASIQEVKESWRKGTAEVAARRAAKKAVREAGRKKVQEQYLKEQKDEDIARIVREEAAIQKKRK